MSRNPSWKEEEVKLALGLYWSHDLKWLARINDKTPEIVTLSKVLNALDLFIEPKGEKFRSVGSIRMKLSNFKSLDSRYGKSSLPNIGKIDRDMWFKYLDNFSQLSSECREILSEHYKGQITADVQNFFDLFNSETSFSYDQNLRAAVTLRNQAALSGDVPLIAQYDALIALLQQKVQIPVSVQTEHGGINQTRITSSQTKIGEYVQQTILEMSTQGLITKELISDFTSAEWSREHFHLRYPFFKEIIPNGNLKIQLRDKNGYLRYWKKIYSLYGKQYVVCKEWFESGRKYFDKWLKSINAEEKYSCKLFAFEKALRKIQKYDQSEVFISAEKLKEDFPNEELDVSSLIPFLVKMGVLVQFQGSTREFNIDDYEMFYKMMESPQDYIKEC